MSSDEKNDLTAPVASEDEDKSSKASSEATAPQISPKKPGSGCGNSEFHHHVVPTEKSGALNVYVQVNDKFYFWLYQFQNKFENEKNM